MQYSSKTQRVVVTPDDDEVFSPPLRALEIFAGDGDVAVVEAHSGATITKTFPSAANGGGYPVVWEINARQVLSTGTTLVADIVGFRG